MTTVLILSALALAAAALIFASRLHVRRDFHDLLRSLRLIGESTRRSLESAKRTAELPGLKNWSDLAVFLWNSRLHVQDRS